jgi:hypothetical protein
MRLRQEINGKDPKRGVCIRVKRAENFSMVFKYSPLVITFSISLYICLLLFPNHDHLMYQGQEDDQQESGISCYTCGLETVDPHLDKVGKSEYPVIHDKPVSFDKLYDFLASFFITSV